MLINKLQKFLDSLPLGENLEDYKSDTLLVTQKFIEQLHLEKYTEEQIKYLENFSKKIEVVRKIVSVYHVDSFKPYNEVHISNELLCKLFCHFMGVFLYTKDYKFLNTLLKLSSHNLDVKWHIPLPLNTIFEENIKDA